MKEGKPTKSNPPRDEGFIKPSCKPKGWKKGLGRNGWADEQKKKKKMGITKMPWDILEKNRKYL